MGFSSNRFLLSLFSGEEDCFEGDTQGTEVRRGDNNDATEMDVPPCKKKNFFKVNRTINTKVPTVSD